MIRPSLPQRIFTWHPKPLSLSFLSLLLLVLSLIWPYLWEMELEYNSTVESISCSTQNLRFSHPQCAQAWQCNESEYLVQGGGIPKCFESLDPSLQRAVLIPGESTRWASESCDATPEECEHMLQLAHMVVLQELEMGLEESSTRAQALALASINPSLALELYNLINTKDPQGALIISPSFLSASALRKRLEDSLKANESVNIALLIAKSHRIEVSPEILAPHLSLDSPHHLMASYLSRSSPVSDN
jgi:hypothetical protein